MANGRVAIVIVVVAIAVLAQLELDEDPLVVERMINIPGPKEMVFPYVAEIENLPQWYPGVVNEHPFDNSELGVGKRYYEFLNLPVLGERKATLEVTKYMPKKNVIAFETDLDLLLPRYEVQCVEHRDDKGKLKTKVIWQMYTRKRSYLYYGTALQFLRIIMKDRVAAALFQLFFKISS
ncbi:uncharacterized protein LOC144451911 [Glandiceps talaboti]